MSQGCNGTCWGCVAHVCYCLKCWLERRLEEEVQLAQQQMQEWRQRLDAVQDELQAAETARDEWRHAATRYERQVGQAQGQGELLYCCLQHWFSIAVS